MSAGPLVVKCFHSLYQEPEKNFYEITYKTRQSYNKEFQTNTLESNFNVYVKPESFADLPEFILLKIFFYLPTVTDVVCAGRVCSQWHAVSKDESLWKRITLNATRLPPHQVDFFLENIPSYISYLKIESSFTKGVVPVLNRKCGLVLKENCPNLNIFIVENFVLLPYFQDTYFNIECLPSNVSIISFRGSIVDPEYFFIHRSKCNYIRVVDLSFCYYIKDEHLRWFNKMDNLTELYLAGCTINDESILKLFEPDFGNHSVSLKLKVLDLENTNVTDRGMGFIYGSIPYLEKLYLGRTNVTFDLLSYLSEEPYRSREVLSFPFPLLTDLCLKNTSVDCTVLCSLVKLKSMKCINLVSSDVSKDYISNLSKNVKEKFRFHDEIEPMQNCAHFNKKYVN